MFKIKWKELGARLSRVFGSQRELEEAAAGLRRAGIAVAQVISPASVARLKPKSKPRVRGGRGTSIVGVDGRTITVGEKCFYQVRGYYAAESQWKRGTLEKVRHTHGGIYAWVRGVYLPWRMVEAKDIRALPLNTAKVDEALKLYPDRIEHHEAAAAFRRNQLPRAA